MILDIRGTHGSGKSTCVRMLLDHYSGWDHPILEEGEHIGYELPDVDAAVVARYTDTGGGCDAVRGGPKEVVRRVRTLFRQHRHVVLEGILVAHTFQRYADLADELGRDSYLFMFLNTPLRNCIARVRGRRVVKGNTKPFNP